MTGRVTLGRVQARSHSFKEQYEVPHEVHNTSEAWLGDEE